MDDLIQQAVLRAIVTMRENLGESLTVDDLARAALFSKFHFTRVFQRVTGVTPGRFLSAMRLQQAKRLLVTTNLNVADISAHVGYNSVGTFSSRFSRSVGMSPTRFRRLAGHAPQIATDPGQPFPHPSTARVYGTVAVPSRTEPQMIFIGLFPERLPEGRPVRCTVLDRPGDFELASVPTGTWYLLAQAVPTHPDRCNDPEAVCVGTVGPLTVRRDDNIEAYLELDPIRALHPPVLLALLDVREHALQAVTAQVVGEQTTTYAKVA